MTDFILLSMLYLSVNCIKRFDNPLLIVDSNPLTKSLFHTVTTFCNVRVRAGGLRHSIPNKCSLCRWLTDRLAKSSRQRFSQFKKNECWFPQSRWPTVDGTYWIQLLRNKLDDEPHQHIIEETWHIERSLGNERRISKRCGHGPQIWCCIQLRRCY